MMTLYEVYDIKTNKYYVGITTRTFSQRKREHLREKKRNSIFHRELQKRPDDFKWYVVSTSFNSLDELLEAEKKRILKRKAFTNGYNATEGGDFHLGHNGIYQKGRRWSEEEKKMLSERRKGKGIGEHNAMANPENRKKVSKAKIGKKRPDLAGNTMWKLAKFTEERRKRLSDNMKGDKNIAKRKDVRKKISEAMTGKNNGYAKKCKIVELKKEFGTYKDCAEYLKVSVAAISSAIKYGYKTKGYHIIKI